MDILDIHTHNHNAMNSICSCSLSDKAQIEKSIYWSASIHPWKLYEEDVEKEIEWVESSLNDKTMLAIGEVGIDKICRTPLQLQLLTFKKIANIASDSHLPLIIHSVRSSNEIIELHKKNNPQNSWIIHGFRGKKELAEAYVNNGFYLSFGEKYNEDALKFTPLDRIFFETDESKLSINEIILKAANIRNMSYNNLSEQVGINVDKVFFK